MHIDDKTSHALNSKFTTNQGINTLLNQFKNALNDNNIKTLRFLIGFFRVSGFVHLHHLLKENKGYERLNVRILVGLNVDSSLYELQQKNLDSKYQEEIFRDLFVREQKRFLKQEPYTEEVDNSVDELLSALKENRLEMRMVRDKNVHAKFYVFASDPKINHTQNYPRYTGSLIVGSSNLTQNGLEKNYEFNLMSNESDDIVFALEEFEKLWKDSIPIESDDIECFKDGSYLKILPPKDIYNKLLLCHFGESFLKTDDSIRGLFKDYTPYDYQIHAVQRGIAMLKAYNGFFLSDVVGLGKTLVASVVAKKCRDEGFITGKILILTPPSLQSSWKKHFDDINIANYDPRTHDSIHKVKDHEQIELVIIDESHNFRSGKGKRYGELEHLCRTPYSRHIQKKVILLSATPQNNAPNDIKNQIFLFLSKRHHGIEGIPDLEKFCNDRQKTFKSIKKKLESLQLRKNDALDNKDIEQQIKEQTEKLKENSDELRDKLLSHIMIRRTRKDIEKLYEDDMEKQNLRFPKPQDPQDLKYDLDDSSLQLAQNTIAFLNQNENPIGDFRYKRYLIFPNLTDEGKKVFIEAYKKNDENQEERKEAFYNDTAERLRVLIQKILFKRFDSSIEAFKSTIIKQINSYDAFVKMFEADCIAIPKNYDSREKLYEAALSDDDEKLKKFLDEQNDNFFIQLERHHFKSDFLGYLKKDKQALEGLLNLWKEVDSDPKLHRLKIFLEKHSRHKIVLFTEAKTTAQYLAQNLENERILQIDSHNREDNEQVIKENFDANYKNQKDDYRIIIATDTLSEGINLHRADIIINYDTPYNATRLMQRIGRINRIGTSFEKIYIYNFKPTNLADEIISINAIAQSKLQSFHYTLGEDSAIYDDEEVVESKNLHQFIESKEKISKDTPYEKDLKELYKDKSEFERVKSLPLKSRTIIYSSKIESFAYIKQNKNDRESFAPYHILPGQTLFNKQRAESCNFYTMADFLKEHLKCEPLKNCNKSLHYAHIKSALEQYEYDHTQKNDINPNHQLKTDERNAIDKVKYCKELGDLIKQRLIRAVEEGNKSLCKKIKDLSSTSLAESLAALAQELPVQDIKNQSSHNENFQPPQIQISITALIKEHK